MNTLNIKGRPGILGNPVSQGKGNVRAIPIPGYAPLASRLPNTMGWNVGGAKNFQSAN
jgi:hypothetical protein